MPGNEIDHLGCGQPRSLDSKCSEKPSKGFKGESGMITYAELLFRVTAWAAAWRIGWDECYLGQGEMSGGGGRNQ